MGGLEDDGLYTPTIKAHSLEKIALHDAYAAVFTTAMRDRWPQLAYLGLFAGAGRTRVEGTNRIVETTALRTFRMPHPFTKYIFVDDDPRCIDALQRRIAALPGTHDVTLVPKDVHQAVPDVIAAMPRYGPGRGLLSLCFIDRYSAALEFRVIRELGSRYKMDFLILLMIGRDIRPNFQRYFDDPDDTRIGALIDDPHWRVEWKSRKLQPPDLVPFVYEKFDAAMTRLGYEAANRQLSHQVRIAGKKVLLYGLVLYGRDSLANRLWNAAKIGVDPNYSLGL